MMRAKCSSGSRSRLAGSALRTSSRTPRRLKNFSSGIWIFIVSGDADWLLYVLETLVIVAQNTAKSEAESQRCSGIGARDNRSAQRRCLGCRDSTVDLLRVGTEWNADAVIGISVLAMIKLRSLIVAVKAGPKSIPVASENRVVVFLYARGLPCVATKENDTPLGHPMAMTVAPN